MRRGASVCVIKMVGRPRGGGMIVCLDRTAHVCGWLRYGNSTLARANGHTHAHSRERVASRRCVLVARAPARATRLVAPPPSARNTRRDGVPCTRSALVSALHVGNVHAAARARRYSHASQSCLPARRSLCVVPAGCVECRRRVSRAVGLITKTRPCVAQSGPSTVNDG